MIINIAKYLLEHLHRKFHHTNNVVIVIDNHFVCGLKFISRMSKNTEDITDYWNTWLIFLPFDGFILALVLKNCLLLPFLLYELIRNIFVYLVSPFVLDHCRSASKLILHMLSEVSTSQLRILNNSIRRSDGKWQTTGEIRWQEIRRRWWCKGRGRRKSRLRWCRGAVVAEARAMCTAVVTWYIFHWYALELHHISTCYKVISHIRNSWLWKNILASQRQTVHK